MPPQKLFYQPTGDQPGPKSEHERVSAWFLGPKAENHTYLGEFFQWIVEAHKTTREKTYPDDPKFISEEIQTSTNFRDEIKNLDVTLKWIQEILSRNSVPFWSPRYNAHMSMESSMPGILGYLTTMLFNPNNVAVEASPFTTLVETVVGLDLCRMLGYQTYEEATPLAWGHITCGGSVANLESMWAARNLKFYPLSLFNATRPGAPLAFVGPTFKIKLCTGVEKLFRECTTWELLNLTPDVVLDLPDRLQKEYKISSTALQATMSDYIIQTVGKDVLERQFDTKEGKYFVATTKHYSWPKSAAITGIGSANLVEVPVDNDARMRVDILDEHLKQCLRDHVPVYAVVAIIGSTEHGAIDPLSSICGLRKKYQRLGLSFAVHADGAWGGYFASTVHMKPVLRAPTDGYVPRMALSPYTENELRHFQHADSITIDPHKSGFLPYPGGGLCYRDGRMRYLITWAAPYLGATPGIPSIGVYGVEGSKPGAAAVGTWLSHDVLGLNTMGYGALLQQVVFSAARMYTQWVTMDLGHESLIVVPFNRLPTERVPRPDSDKILEQRKYIRDRIVAVNNYDLRNPADKDYGPWELLTEIGSDLCINAFACNFKVDGKVNEDIAECSYMNSRIYDELSMTGIMHPDDTKQQPPPFIVMTTVMEQAKYRDCLTTFKNRLGLLGSQDLTVLSNCVMSPFPTDKEFQDVAAKAFKDAAEKVLKECIERNKLGPVKYSFVMQGTDLVYLVLVPQFALATRRHQLIIQVTLPEAAMNDYVTQRNANPTTVFFLTTKTDVDIGAISTENSSFQATIQKGGFSAKDPTIIDNFEVKVQSILVNQPIGSKHWDARYPDQMPFYLFGGAELHLDHLLLRAPNVQITMPVTFEPDPEASTGGIYGQFPSIAVFDTVNEWSMQPFGDLTDVPGENLFNKGEQYRVTIYGPVQQPEGPGLIRDLGYPITAGTITIGSAIYIDSKELNRNPHVGTQSAPSVNDTWDSLLESREQRRAAAEAANPTVDSQDQT